MVGHCDRGGRIELGSRHLACVHLACVPGNAADCRFGSISQPQVRAAGVGVVFPCAIVRIS
jgi:hypothetical protein